MERRLQTQNKISVLNVSKIQNYRVRLENGNKKKQFDWLQV